MRGIPILSRVLVSLLTEEKSPPVHLVASTAMQGRKRRAEAQLAGYISENFWPARVTPSNSVEVLPASKPSFPFWSDF